MEKEETVKHVHDLMFLLHENFRLQRQHCETDAYRSCIRQFAPLSCYIKRWTSVESSEGGNTARKKYCACDFAPHRVVDLTYLWTWISVQSGITRSPCMHVYNRTRVLFWCRVRRVTSCHARAWADGRVFEDAIYYDNRFLQSNLSRANLC